MPLEAMTREKPPEFPPVRDCIPQFRRPGLQTACHGGPARPHLIRAGPHPSQHLGPLTLRCSLSHRGALVSKCRTPGYRPQ